MCLSNLGFSIIIGWAAKTVLEHVFVVQNVLSQMPEKKWKAYSQCTPLPPENCYYKHFTLIWVLSSLNTGKPSSLSCSLAHVSVHRNHDETAVLTSNVPFAVVNFCFSVSLRSLISANIWQVAEKVGVTLVRACLGPWVESYVHTAESPAPCRGTVPVAEPPLLWSVGEKAKCSRLGWLGTSKGVWRLLMK